MMPALGFVILSHSAPAQLRRLVQALNGTYGNPPIAIHHDFSQATLDVTGFSPNVCFAVPHVKTSWGNISVVHAALAALRLLYRDHSPDWFTLLSASDYPVMKGEEVVRTLQQGRFDLYMDYLSLERTQHMPERPSTKLMGKDRAEWRDMAYDRYVAKVWRYPSLTKRLKYTHRQIVFRNEVLLAPFAPFPKDWKFYGGDHWFTGNRKVADILLASETNHPALFRHYADRILPEESIWHTLLCNHHELAVSRDNKRYTRWDDGAWHPHTIELSDLEEAAAQGCHFARKFSPADSGKVLGAIDQRLDLVKADGA